MWYLDTPVSLEVTLCRVFPLCTVSYSSLLWPAFSPLGSHCQHESARPKNDSLDRAETALLLKLLLYRFSKPSIVCIANIARSSPYAPDPPSMLVKGFWPGKRISSRMAVPKLTKDTSESSMVKHQLLQGSIMCEQGISEILFSFAFSLG